MQEPGYSQNLPPIPSPSGDGVQGVIPPLGSAQVNFDVIGRAWQVLQSNLATWVVAGLIQGAAIGLIYGIMMMAIMVPAMKMQAMQQANPGSVPVMAGPNPFLMLIFYVLIFFVGCFFGGGFCRMAVNQVRTGQTSVGDLFSVTDVLPSIFVASLLAALASMVGVLACFVGAFVIQALLMFTFFLIVDKKISPIDALATSWNALKGQAVMATVFLFVISIVSGLGALVCGVGALVTGPLALLSIATLYRDFFPD